MYLYQTGVLVQFWFQLYPGVLLGLDLRMGSFNVFVQCRLLFECHTRTPMALILVFRTLKLFLGTVEPGSTLQTLVQAIPRAHTCFDINRAPHLPKEQAIPV